MTEYQMLSAELSMDDGLELWTDLEGVVESIDDETRLLGRPPASSDENRSLRVRISADLLEAIRTDETGALARQYVSSAEEVNDLLGLPDPLNEQGDSPVHGLVHRYQNRAALHLTNACASFCRFCLRKRKIGQRDYTLRVRHFERVIGYLGDHPEIRDIVLTGGDPLALSNNSLAFILSRLRSVAHLDIIRVDTRFPVQTPARIDAALVSVLRGARPLYVILHVNHPNELTPGSRAAISTLADAGVPLLSHTVLLRGVNDRREILESLFMELVKLGAKPYHLYQANRVRGTSHFIVPLQRAIDLVSQLWGRSSGLAIPIFVYNAESGLGKIPLLPGSPILHDAMGNISFVNYEGEIAVYVGPTDDNPIRVRSTTDDDPSYPDNVAGTSPPM